MIGTRVTVGISQVRFDGNHRFWCLHGKIIDKILAPLDKTTHTVKELQHPKQNVGMWISVTKYLILVEKVTYHNNQGEIHESDSRYEKYQGGTINFLYEALPCELKLNETPK